MALPDVCVVYLVRAEPVGEPSVLLGHKQTGLGRGRIVGIGGKVDPGESVRHAAVRELQEETGLVADEVDLRSAGAVDYLFPSRPAWSQRSHVFLCRRWSGEPAASAEIVPEWFALSAVPYARMWDDAARWLPSVLTGGSIDAEFTFGEDLATVVAERIPR